MNQEDTHIYIYTFPPSIAYLEREEGREELVGTSTNIFPPSLTAPSPLFSKLLASSAFIARSISLLGDLVVREARGKSGLDSSSSRIRSIFSCKRASLSWSAAEAEARDASSVRHRAWYDVAQRK